MPYIDQKTRDDIVEHNYFVSKDPAPKNPGELNYFITKLILRYKEDCGCPYLYPKIKCIYSFL